MVVWGLRFSATSSAYYWFHRASHECRLFWASHVVASLVPAIQPVDGPAPELDGTFISWIFWAWLPLDWLPKPIMVLTMQAVSLLYQFWIHTEFVRRR